MKKKYFKLLLLSSMFCIAQVKISTSQTISSCGTDEMRRQLIAQHPELIQQEIDYNNAIKELIKSNSLEKTAEQVYIIPVVFHVIHVYGSENISDAQINNAMTILNRDYAKLNSDINKIIKGAPFDTLASVINVKFRLAQLDPNGQCTNGIDRIYSHTTFQANNGAKLNQWPRDKYLNIWTVHDLQSQGAFQPAAYAQFPGDVTQAWNAANDGVIAFSTYIGDNTCSGCTGAGFSSRTLTHEIGHYFNLEHPWGNNNSAGDVCGDDGVDDTPITKGHLSCDSVPHCQVSWAKRDTFSFNGVHLTVGSALVDPTIPSANPSSFMGAFVAHGVPANPFEAQRFSFSGWGTGAHNGDTLASQMTGAIDTSKYYEVKIGPANASYILTIQNGMDFNVKRDINGVRNFAVRYSADNFAVNRRDTIIPSSPYLARIGNSRRGFYYAKDTNTIIKGCHVILDSLGPIVYPNTATIRIYGWNAESSSGSFSIDDVKFNCNNGFVADTLVYNFNSFFPPSSLDTVDQTPPQVDTAVASLPFTAHGVGAHSLESLRFSYNGWDTCTVNTNNLNALLAVNPTPNLSKYYEVTMGAQYGNMVSLTGIDFNVKRSLNGIRTFAVRSSLDNYATNLPASIISNNNLMIDTLTHTNVFYYKHDTNTAQSGCHITLGSAFANITSVRPVKFHFYAWNAEDSTGTFSIDNVQFAETGGLIENFQNYMDYSYCPPNGQIMFTKGQKNRIRAAAESNVSYRNNLWSPGNLVATGLKNNVIQQLDTSFSCAPSVDFYTANNTLRDVANICQGSTINFVSQILNLHSTDPTPTYLWNFNGGTGPTNTANPAVTFANAGDYDVTLTVTNSHGSNSVTKHNYIHVDPSFAQYYGITAENFENYSGYYWNWLAENLDGNAHGWSLVNGIGYSGTHSWAMNGYGNYAQDVDDIVTPEFNLHGLTGASLTFRCAAATNALVTANMTETLKVYRSTNCGQTWLAPISYAGTALCNNGYYANAFYPNSQNQWDLKTIPLPAIQGNVRFKFEYTTGLYSNNIYIDDININGTVGISENVLDNSSVSIYPNPTNDASTVFYHLNNKANVKIELIDVLGKKVMEINNNNQGEGDYSYKISKLDYNLKNGIYFVKFSVDDNSITKKIIFTE